MRKVQFGNLEFYHIFNRSIAGYKIFNNAHEYLRFNELISYYKTFERKIKFSDFKRQSFQSQREILENTKSLPIAVNIIAYCLMPTHFHLILRQNLDSGIVNFVKVVTDSYSRYFNILHKRRGPLWEGRFKSVHIETDEQLLHLTRYIHLNPTSANLVGKPELWEYSSFKEYLDKITVGLCDFKEYINMSPKEYKKFVNDHKYYQRQISIIKSQLIDNYSG